MTRENRHALALDPYARAVTTPLLVAGLAQLSQLALGKPDLCKFRLDGAVQILNRQHNTNNRIESYLEQKPCNQQLECCLYPYWLQAVSYAWRRQPDKGKQTCITRINGATRVIRL